METVGQRLERLITERGDDMAALSRLIGRNAAYIQQFIRRGVPRRLSEDDRRTLAEYFGVDERSLGGPPTAGGAALALVPRLAVRASAGPGAFDANEAALDHIGFDRQWLRRTASSPDAVSMIKVTGDSMLPTLRPGDDILVDRGDGASRLRDGIYVLRVDDTLLVKRVALTPVDTQLTIRSDNPTYPEWANVDRQTIDIIGRVIWSGGRIR